MSLAQGGRLSELDLSSLAHSMLMVKDEDILHITNKSIKIEPDKIVSDIKKREIPRFRSNPPGTSVVSALQNLIKVDHFSLE